MDNKAIAKVFEEMGNILDIKGKNFFRVNAYRKGALTVINLPQDLRNLVEEDPKSLEKIPGIGKGLQEKIVELVKTGKCLEHEKLKEDFPNGLLEMLEVRTLGPKKVKLLYSELGIEDLNGLKKAAQEGKIHELEGMGEKSEKEILKALEEYSQFSKDRHLVDEALQEAERYINYLKKCKEIRKIQYAGSLRRSQETIGDIDILTTVSSPEKSHEKIMDFFTEYEDVINVIAKGDTKSSVILQSGIQVDLRVVASESFGAALHYFTGNKEHNIKIRDIAKKKGWKVNEYGLFKGDKMLIGETEEEIFEKLGLCFIPPEIRSNNGEFEYAESHKSFPKFVEVDDIKADLHCHSKYSDGKNTILEMAETFIERGYDYFAITDHSSAVGITGGMDEKKIKKQWKEIEELNKELNGKIKILKGCEVDILKDGELDFDDTILKNLDIVVASAHLHARLDEQDQTKRLLKALKNPYVRILGHPTGRLINKRPEMNFDMEKIIDACVDNKVVLEINSNPMRLDLVDKYIRIAKDKGAKFAINTDSHSVDHPEFIKFGIGIARRGWLTPKDVVNTWDYEEFDNYF